MCFKTETVYRVEYIDLGYPKCESKRTAQFDKLDIANGYAQEKLSDTKRYKNVTLLEETTTTTVDRMPIV